MDKIQLLNSFRQMYEELNHILCQFDPYGLSDGGKITDEFDDEAWNILYGLIDTHDLNEVVQLITVVFAKSFNSIDFNEKSCFCVANRIHDWWTSK